SVFGFQFTELARWRRLLKTENSKLDTGEVMATEVVMPQMGESIAEGTITKWLKNVGDKVERDEPLFEISTDKVDAEIPSPSAGTLTEIKHKEGETVEVAEAKQQETPATVEQPAQDVPPAAPEAPPQIEIDLRRRFWSSWWYVLCWLLDSCRRLLLFRFGYFDGLAFFVFDLGQRSRRGRWNLGINFVG